MVVDLPEQALVDRYLPELQLEHRFDHTRPRLYGGVTTPRDTRRQREDIQTAMELVPEVLAEAIEEFEEVFGRRPQGAVCSERTSDADTILVASSTVARTAQQVVDARRASGERVGLVKVKLFRPFPRDELLPAIGAAGRVAVLDRNHSPGSGGIFWSEVAASLRERHELLVQGYIVGLAGTDVSAATVDSVVSDVQARTAATNPVFKYGESE